MIHLKKLMIGLFVLALTISGAWGIAHFIGGTAIDYLFFSSLFLTIVIRLFTSSVGFFLNNLQLATQAQLLIKVDEVRNPSPQTNTSYAFTASLIYTMICFLAMIIYYWEKY
ncbi:MAG: hypothetical protein ACI35O_03170 [Bacillaceae bacterium]